MKQVWRGRPLSKNLAKIFQGAAAGGDYPVSGLANHQAESGAATTERLRYATAAWTSPWKAGTAVAIRGGRNDQPVQLWSS